jgi:hypothetical protein
MSETHRIEIELDDRRFEALELEAHRLGLEVPQLVTKAASAWLCDVTENSACATATATPVAN